MNEFERQLVAFRAGHIYKNIEHHIPTLKAAIGDDVLGSRYVENIEQSAQQIKKDLQTLINYAEKEN